MYELFWKLQNVFSISRISEFKVGFLCQQREKKIDFSLHQEDKKYLILTLQKYRSENYLHYWMLRRFVFAFKPIKLKEVSQLSGSEFAFVTFAVEDTKKRY